MKLSQKDKKDKSENNNSVFLSFISQRGCTISVNLRITGKYKQSLMMSEIPKHIKVEAADEHERIKSTDVFKMNSRCLQLFNQIEDMVWLSRFEKDTMID